MNESDWEFVDQEDDGDTYRLRVDAPGHGQIGWLYRARAFNREHSSVSIAFVPLPRNRAF